MNLVVRQSPGLRVLRLLGCQRPEKSSAGVGWVTSIKVEGRTAEVTEVVREDGQRCDMRCPSLSHKSRTWVSSPSRSQQSEKENSK